MGASIRPDAHGLAPLTTTAIAPGAHAMALAENPGYPTFYVTFIRDKKKVEYTILPTKFELVSSVKASDKLEFTVPDEAYTLINEAFLTEDLKTTVEFSFGYPDMNHMSEVRTLVFFRQAPEFAQDVTTTIVAYDKGLFLAIPTVPKTIRKKDAANGQDQLMTFNEVVKYVVDDVNDLFKDVMDQPLEVEFNGHEWKGEHFRMVKPHGSALEYLLWMRNFGDSAKNPERGAIEVFVKDHILFFRPAQKRENPIAVYDYFSTIDGERLLSFKPEVNLALERKTIADVNPTTGEPTETTVGNKENAPDRARLTGKLATSGHDGTHRVVPPRTGDKKRDDPEADDVVLTYVVQQGDTSLDQIAPKFAKSAGEKSNITAKEIFAQNKSLLDSPDAEHAKLTPGMTLTVRTENITDKTTPNKGVTPVNRTKAALSYIYDEDQAVKASATVIGDPRLIAGWPIVVRNVGARWEGLWYVEEVKHTFGSEGYLCELSLNRDGFILGEEYEQASGTPVLETPALDAKEQADKKKQRAAFATSGHDGTHTR